MNLEALFLIQEIQWIGASFLSVLDNVHLYPIKESHDKWVGIKSKFPELDESKLTKMFYMESILELISENQTLRDQLNYISEN